MAAGNVLGQPERSIVNHYSINQTEGFNALNEFPQSSSLCASTKENFKFTKGVSLQKL